MTTYVLDSSAIVCFLRSEPGAEVVARLLAEPNNQHYVHAINWVEIRYLEKRDLFSKGKSVSDFMRTAEVMISNDLTLTFVEAVASLKADYPPIALGDCFAVPLLKHLTRHW